MLLNSSPSLILFISAAGVIQAVVLAALLYFHPKSDRSVNLFLALHILTMSIFMLMPVVQQVFSWQAIIILVPFQFLIGPFLYLYICSFKEQITWRRAIPHFLLFFVSAVTNYYLYSTWVYKYPFALEAPPEVLLDPASYMPILIRNLQMLLYFFLARSALMKYQRSINHLFSETSRIDLAWIKSFLKGFLFLIISVMVLAFFVFKFPQYFDLLILINTAIVTPYIYIVTFKGIAQTTLWQLHPDKKKVSIEKQMIEAEATGLTQKENNESPLATKGLSAHRVKEIASDITRLMEKDKLYQEPELTLQVLAEKLGYQAYQVSQAINEGFSKSFYQLVNGYRVEEAKRLLGDERNRNYTLLSVGFEAGFNSKTTFNTVFKKFTGLTPTEYRAKQKQTVV